jgi:hypothetical protein
MRRGLVGSRFALRSGDVASGSFGDFRRILCGAH